MTFVGCIVQDKKFRASEFPDVGVWGAEKVMVHGCEIIVDAPLPSHAEYIACRFDGWPTSTPDPRPVRFAQNYVRVMEQWMAEDNVYEIAGSQAQTSLSTFVLKGGKDTEGG